VVAGVAATRARLTRELERKDRAREQLIAASRQIVREASAAISAMVRGEDPSARVRAARAAWGRAFRTARENQDLAATGPLDGALQELAEAEVLRSILRHRPLPSHLALRVPAAPYLMGVADCIGELRRLALNALANGSVDEARLRLRQMETLDDLLSQMHFPSGLLPLRKRQDVARGLIERTRGEVVLGSMMATAGAERGQRR
jgi:translin